MKSAFAKAKRRFSTMRLHQQLLAVYAMVLVIPVLLFGMGLQYMSNRFVLRNTETAISAMVKSVSGELSLKMEQFNQLITMYIYQVDLQKYYRNNYISQYEKYYDLTHVVVPVFQIADIVHNHMIESLRVYSLTGLQPYGAFIRSADAVLDEAWFQHAMEQGGIHWMLAGEEMTAVCRIDPISPLYGRTPMGVFRLTLSFPVLLKDHLLLDWEAYRLTIHDASGAELFAGEYGDESLLSRSRHELQSEFYWETGGWTFRYSFPSDGMLAFGVHPLTLVAILALAALLFIVTLRGIRSLIRRARQTEREIISFENHILRAQIDPHFLYNTLSYVNWKALRAGQVEISKIINSISTFYRTCLNQGQPMTSLRNEFENARAYADIQQRLHDGSFDVDIALEERLEDYQILNFLLQPLLENSITHGIDKAPDRRGSLRVWAQAEEGVLAIYVEDNGVGMAEEAIERLLSPRKPGDRYGVHYVQRRIQLYYGEAYGLSYTNRAEDGLTAILRLPLLTHLPIV